MPQPCGAPNVLLRHIIFLLLSHMLALGHAFSWVCTQTFSLPLVRALPCSARKRPETARAAFGLGVRVCTNDAPLFLIPPHQSPRVRWLRGAPNVTPRLIPFLRVSHVLAPKHTFHALPANMDFALRRILPKRHPDFCPGSIFFVPARAPSKNKIGASEAFACVRAGLSGRKTSRHG